MQNNGSPATIDLLFTLNLVLSGCRRPVGAYIFVRACPCDTDAALKVQYVTNLPQDQTFNLRPLSAPAQTLSRKASAICRMPLLSGLPHSTCWLWRQSNVCTRRPTVQAYVMFRMMSYVRLLRDYVMQAWNHPGLINLPQMKLSAKCLLSVGYFKFALNELKCWIRIFAENALCGFLRNGERLPVISDV